jgi:hypothetical protein
VSAGVTTLRTEESITGWCGLKLIESERLLLLSSSVRADQ